jgi:Sec20
MSHTLTHRLQSLYESYKSTLNLIQDLHSLAPNTPDSDTPRIELANEIHDAIKEQEDTLDLLRQELDDPSPSTFSRRNAPSHNDNDHDRNADLIARLSEDLKSARQKFRRAQLAAKRSADESKRKERELLFKRSSGDVNESGNPIPNVNGMAQGKRGPATQHLTQEDIARNSSEDVTRALRRTHALMQSNLSQSQFAQQTLDESQTALQGLGESYGGTADLLKLSKGLAGLLVRSNKSDTWYLQMAFYMLGITIAWLFFRRILYGPLWWLVLQPLRLLWKMTFLALGGMGLGRTEVVSAGFSSVVSVRTAAGLASSVAKVSTKSGVNSRGIPTNPPGAKPRTVRLPAKGGGWGGGAPPPDPGSMVERVGRMMDGEETDVDDISDEERGKQEQQSRNPKKRMMEVEVEDKMQGKDEL